MIETVTSISCLMSGIRIVFNDRMFSLSADQDLGRGRDHDISPGGTPVGRVDRSPLLCS